MTQNNIITIDGGSAAYWLKRKEGFWLIREAERAARHLETAPMYIAGNWDEKYGDYEAIENLEPAERMDAAIQAIEANDTAVNILVAQRRTRIGEHEITAVMEALRR
ncbi:TPA: hypothetical protein NOE00_002086 [Pseudomonas aeruginosa]|nr:hypothetical protein [Pseudomonas aeruginosa]